MIESLILISEATAKIFSFSDLINPIWTGITNINGKVVDIYNNPPNLAYGNYRITVEHCDYDVQFLDFTVPDQTILKLELPCSSALSTHSSTMNSVHNFDVLGYAPAQIHDNLRHSEVFENSANRGMSNGYCELDGSGYVPSKRISSTINNIRYESVTANIQAAINEVASSLYIDKLIVTGDHILTSSLFLYGDNKDYEFLGHLKAPNNDAAITMGNKTTPLRHSYIKVGNIFGMGIGNGDGIKMINAVRNMIFVNNFRELSKGIHIYADGTYETPEQGYVNDNQIFFNDMRFLDYGIYFNPSMTGDAEGNQFQGSIFGTNYAGLYIRGPSSMFTGFSGVIDCVWNPASKDVDDTVGYSTYIFRFVRDTRNPAINTFQFKNSLVWNANSGRLDAILRLGTGFGIGNQYACFNNDGSIYGSLTPCL